MTRHVFHLAPDACVRRTPLPCAFVTGGSWRGGGRRKATYPPHPSPFPSARGPATRSLCSHRAAPASNCPSAGLGSRSRAPSRRSPPRRIAVSPSGTRSGARAPARAGVARAAPRRGARLPRCAPRPRRIGRSTATAAEAAIGRLRVACERRRGERAAAPRPRRDASARTGIARACVPPAWTGIARAVLPPALAGPRRARPLRPRLEAPRRHSRRVAGRSVYS